MVQNATYNHVINKKACVSSSLFIALGRMSLPQIALHNNIRYIYLAWSIIRLLRTHQNATLYFYENSASNRVIPH